jgi:hypothetical protein
MKHLKKFENFNLDEEEMMPGNKKMAYGKHEEEECPMCMCSPCKCNDMEEDMYMEEEEDEHEPPQHEMTLEKKKVSKGKSYKKSGLKNPEKADLNKDKKISGYEKARGKAVQNAIEKEKGEKGLTAKQKKLPEGLRKAIEARKKK